MPAETFTWDRVARLTDILYGVAATRGLISYDQAAKQVGLARHHMSWHLMRVSRQSAEDGGPMWTVLCVSVETDRPADQFYELARELRPEYADLDDEEIWEAESERCYEAVG